MVYQVLSCVSQANFHFNTSTFIINIYCFIATVWLISCFHSNLHQWTLLMSLTAALWCVLSALCLALNHCIDDVIIFQTWERQVEIRSGLLSLRWYVNYNSRKHPSVLLRHPSSPLLIVIIIITSSCCCPLETELIVCLFTGYKVSI